LTKFWTRRSPAPAPPSPKRSSRARPN
jgi:hypothetical protein